MAGAGLAMQRRGVGTADDGALVLERGLDEALDDGALDGGCAALDGGRSVRPSEAADVLLYSGVRNGSTYAPLCSALSMDASRTSFNCSGSTSVVAA